MDPTKLRALLQAISQLESSGGLNTNHQVINDGLQAGQQAIGNYGMLPNTIREVAHRMSVGGEPVPDELNNIKDMSDDDIHDTMDNNKHLQNYMAGDLLSRILNKTQGNPEKAVYMWNNGHNMDPASIDNAALGASPYVQKFRALKGKIKGL